MDLPFKEATSDGIKIRKFAGDVDQSELVWHRDRTDRRVVVLQSDGWYLQLDEALPQMMRPGDVYYIPKETWHRVIRRSDSPLVVEIIEIPQS